ncbi:MAG: cytochrome P450, partial [Myxococcota bacterium]
GIGEHFCLGASLARRSATALFRELARRLERVELAGEPARVRSSFVAGLKHLPIRYRVAPA